MNLREKAEKCHADYILGEKDKSCVDYIESTLIETRNEALEEAAKECEDKMNYEREAANTSVVSQYRKDKADGAEECSTRIRALKEQEKDEG